MPHVVKNPEAQDEIKRTYPIWRQVKDVDVEGFDLRAESFLCKLEAGFRPPAPSAP